MKLYFAPGACSLSPHIVLREAGLDFTPVKVNLRTHQTEDGSDYTSVNPKGYVPALLLDDGSLLTEGPAIVQYLADRNPAAGLAPAAGTIERYRLQEWLNFISTELHKTIGALFNPSVPEDWKKVVLGTIDRRLDQLVSQLGDKTWAMGTQFSVADAYLFTVLSWTKHLGIDLSTRPTLPAYLARVAARPAVQAALKAEGLL